MVVCLKWGADLHMAQLMSQPLTVSRFSKIKIGFTFLVQAYPDSPRKRAVKRACVCVSRLQLQEKRHSVLYARSQQGSSRVLLLRYCESNTWTSLKLRLTTRLNKNARPVAPVNRVDISSARFVSGVSQLAQRKILDPPRWLKNMRPMLLPSMHVYDCRLVEGCNVLTMARINTIQQKIAKMLKIRPAVLWIIMFRPILHTGTKPCTWALYKNAPLTHLLLIPE